MIWVAIYLMTWLLENRNLFGCNQRDVIKKEESERDVTLLVLNLKKGGRQTKNICGL